jgi:signal transduction histidine kinase
MIALPHSPDPGRRSRSGDRLLAFLTSGRRPPYWLSLAIIWSQIFFIGLVDVLLGPHVSLRLFYYIPIALAVAWQGWRGGVAASAGSVLVWLVGDFINGSEVVHRNTIWWNATIFFAMFLVMAWVLDVLLGLHRDLEQRVRDRTAALEQEMAARLRLQREILEVSERERSSIGHDLHDGLSQHLAGTALAAQVLAEQLAARAQPDAAGDARRVVQLVEEGIAQTRRVARGLLLASVKPDRLTAELEELATTTARESGVPCRFAAEGDPIAPDIGTASHLYRIAQEAVRNSLRHARPDRLEIVLAAGGSGLTLTVSDDGAGMPGRRPHSGLGLRIMAHRAEILHGELAIEARPGGGTRVRCRIPTRAAAVI